MVIDNQSADSPVDHRARHTKLRRLRALGVILVVEATVTALVVANNPAVAEEWAKLTHRNVATSELDYGSLAAADPKVGSDMSNLSPIQLLLSGHGAPQGMPGRGVLIVWVGRCAGCIKGDVGGWERLAAQDGVPTALLTSAPPLESEKFRRQEHLSSPIIQDSDGKCAQELNAILAPRAYFIGPDGRLLWLASLYSRFGNPFDDHRLRDIIRSERSK